MTNGLDRRVETRLRDRGVRYTSGRRALVRALVESDGPRSATELHGTLDGRMPLSSLYRSLAVLEEAGILSPHLGTRGMTRYELAEWLTGHHHHLTCVECGAVEDIPIPPGQEGRLRDLIEEIARSASFEPGGHALEIEGRCRRCT